MKAAEDIVIAQNKDDVIVPYKSGYPTKDLKITEIKKGEEIPKQFLKRFAERNLEWIADVKYINKVPVNLPTELELNLPEVSKTMKIEKRKYSQESLTKIKNEKGFSALKEIGKEFGVTDRSSKRLITEILREQEVKQRKGL